MKKQILSFLILIIFALNVCAQSKEAQKIDEFEFYNCEEIKARLDAFTFLLRREPQAKGYVIVYEGNYSGFVYKKNGEREFKAFLPTVGEAIHRSYFIQNYLVGNKGFTKQDVIFISGGYRQNHKVEFWIVPLGATPPKPVATLENIEYRKGKPLDLHCAG